MQRVLNLPGNRQEQKVFVAVSHNQWCYWGSTRITQQGEQDKEKKTEANIKWYLRIQIRVVKTGEKNCSIFAPHTPFFSGNTKTSVSLKLRQNSFRLLLEGKKWAENAMKASKMLKIKCHHKQVPWGDDHRKAIIWFIFCHWNITKPVQVFKVN